MKKLGVGDIINAFQYPVIPLGYVHNLREVENEKADFAFRQSSDITHSFPL